jgi:protein-S-isoprenylcysteine O-methyltransferase Ste14
MRPSRLAIHANRGRGNRFSLSHSLQLGAKDEEEHDAEEDELYGCNNEQNDQDIAHASSSLAARPPVASGATATLLPYTHGGSAANTPYANVCSRIYGVDHVVRRCRNFIQNATRRQFDMTADAIPGRHAAWWVAAQIPLLAITITVPVAQAMLRVPGPWPRPLNLPARLFGAAMLVLAVIVFRAATHMLGPALVATPAPVQGAVLRQSGIYGTVRHPIYAAILSGVFGWALLWNSIACLGLAVFCSMFFLAKIRYEEALLMDVFPEYVEYRRRVPALVPGWRRRRPS